MGVGGEGGETCGIKLSAARGTPLTHCNPKMKVGELGDGGRLVFLVEQLGSLGGLAVETLDCMRMDEN